MDSMDSVQQLKEDLSVLRREVLLSGEASVNLPVNLKRLIWNAQERFQCRNVRSGPTGNQYLSPVLPAAELSCILRLCPPCVWRSVCHIGLSPLKVILEVRQLCTELHVVVGEDDLSVEAKRNATLLFHAFLRATLAAKRVLAEYRLSEDAFDYLIGEIKTRVNEVRQF